MDIEQVLRRWLAGEKIRAIARSTRMARNTVKNIVKLAIAAGLRVGDGWPEESRLQAIRTGMNRPGAPDRNETESALLGRKEQIEHWLKKDRLLLTKIHELLARDGVEVSYSTLYRFATKHCEFGSSSVTVRRMEVAPGEAPDGVHGPECRHARGRAAG